MCGNSLKSSSNTYISSFVVFLRIIWNGFVRCLSDLACLCWCCLQDLRGFLTSAVVTELPFLHIPGAVEVIAVVHEGERP